jgi:ABC-type oligopeptide transport system substrate-binding subunit
MMMMHVINGVAYAEEKQNSITVKSIRALDDYRLWIRFSTGETKTFDFTHLLENNAFKPLKDKSIFNSVYVDYGIPIWNEGAIDIAPEYLYTHGID